jgi:hypothetical protein
MHCAEPARKGKSVGGCRLWRRVESNDPSRTNACPGEHQFSAPDWLVGSRPYLQVYDLEPNGLIAAINEDVTTSGITSLSIQLSQPA